MTAEQRPPPGGPPSGAAPSLSDEELDVLRGFGAEREAAAGELLFQAGDERYDFFVILEGRVAIVENHGRPDERVIVEHGARRFLGELNLLTGQAVYLTAVVTERSRVIAIDVDSLRRLIAEQPALSELVLRVFLLRRSMLLQVAAGLRIAGSRFSPDTRRLLEFLSRNRVPHVWLDLEEDVAAEELLREFGVAPEETPLVIWRGGAVLRNPSTADLARVIGVSSAAPAADLVDLVVIGAGPGGLAAAVYGASEGLRTFVVESVAVGGQANTSTRIENYLGFPAGLSGADLAARGAVQAEKFRARIATPAEAVSLRTEGPTHVVELAGGEEIAARAVVVATGARYRRLDIPGLADFEKLGVYYAATETEAQMCRDRPVAIVGGGNSAGQAAVYLAARAEHVYVLIRKDRLSDTMSRYLVDQVERHPSITLLARTQVRELHGDGELRAITVERDGEPSQLDVGGLFVFIGAQPHTAWLSGAIELDERGFVLTGRDVPVEPGTPSRGLLETSRPGVFCAGDVRSGSMKRVASAVGEGSMAGFLAHAHLGASLRDGVVVAPRARSAASIVIPPEMLRRGAGLAS